MAVYGDRPVVVAFVVLVWTAFFAVMHRGGYLPLALVAVSLFWLLVFTDVQNFGVRPQRAGAYTGLLTGIFTVLALLHQRMRGRSRQLPILLAFAVALLFALVAGVFIGHNVKFGAPLTSVELYAIYQTDPAEVFEFLVEFMDPRFLAAAVVGSLALGALTWSQQRVRAGRFGTVEVTVLLLVSIALSTHFRRSFGLFDFIVGSATTYRQELAAFRELQEQRRIGQVPVIAAKDGQGETYVVVIGESLSRSHMSLYGYHRDTTPLLDLIFREGELLRFENAVATHTNTMHVLSSALTEASQRNGRHFSESPSIVDVARAAGFETYWITNQALVGTWDNAVSILAHGADHLLPLNRNVGRSTVTSQHDGATIAVLEEVLASPAHGNRMIFVHLMGSHPRFCSRYPESFGYFERDVSRGAFGRALDRDSARVARWVECYDNSVRYNDHVVAALLRQTQQIEGTTAFLYLADHGQDVVGGNLHHASRFRYTMVEIPMLIWLSKEYRSKYGEKLGALHAHRDRVFPTDFLYDTALGLTGIRTLHYDGSADLASETYVSAGAELRVAGANRSYFSPDNARFHQRENVRRLTAAGLEARVIPHRVNTTGKLAQVLYDGFRGLELDLLFRPGESGGYFELGHDEGHATANELSRFLARMPAKGIDKLWFDVKNLDAANTEAVRAELLRLDNALGLRQRVIFESPSVSQLTDIGRDGFHTSYYLPTGLLRRLDQQGDDEGLRAEARRIARDVRNARVAAVSFDAALLGFVKEHLEPLLPQDMPYHTWDLNLSLGDPDFTERLTGSQAFRDPRVETILVRYASEFTL